MIIVDRVNNLDVMEVHVEMNDEFFSDKVSSIEAVERKLRHDIESTIGISARIKLVENRSIQRSEGKARRVIDKRKLY